MEPDVPQVPGLFPRVRLEGVTTIERPHVLFKQWLLISGGRRVVTVSLLAFVYAVLLGLWLVRPVEIQVILSETNTVQQLLNTLLSGAILLVSIVVSINSLVVSQELAPIGSQHERVVDSWEFREEAAETVKTDVSPASPGEFLETILRAVNEDLDDLASATSDLEAPARGALTEYVEETRDEVERIQSVLTPNGEYAVNIVLFGSEYDFSRQVDNARSIRVRHSSAFTEQVQTTLERIISSLQYFVTAREYFKSFYFKREFSSLSRDLLYAGLPAILVNSYVLLALDAAIFPGRTFGISNLFLFFSLAYVISLAPFLVLTSYILRAAVISEDTVSAGGFILDT